MRIWIELFSGGLSIAHLTYTQPTSLTISGQSSNDLEVRDSHRKKKYIFFSLNGGRISLSQEAEKKGKE